MRIGIVINSSWNIFNFRKGLIKAFKNAGHEVIAIAPNDGRSGELQDLGCLFQEVAIARKGTNPVSDLGLVFSLFRIYREVRLDVALHFTIKPNIYGTLAARLAGIPSINNVTGLGTVFIRENYKSKIARFLYRFSFQFPELVFFQNHDDRALFLSKGLVKKKKTGLLPGSGIDLDFFLPGSFQRKEEFVFLLVARLLFDKGIVEFIGAAEQLLATGVKSKFQLLGAVEDDKGLGVSKEQVREWQAKGIVEYLGKVEDVRSLVRKADCLVLPSYREGTPRSLLEGASLGKPMIATDVPGCREVVKDGYNGFLCKVKDPLDLAEKMERMLGLSRDGLKEMGKNSRRLAVTRFDQEIVSERYLSAIEKIGD